jgi:hypothetical protein
MDYTTPVIRKEESSKADNAKESDEMKRVRDTLTWRRQSGWIFLCLLP